MGKIKVFINPVSGNGVGQQLAEQRGAWHTIIINPVKIREQLQRELSEGDILIIAGGDGTMTLVLSSLVRLKLQDKVQVRCLPLGTGNDLARALHITKQTLNDLASKQPQRALELPLWQLGPHLFCNYISWGMDAKITAEVAKWRKKMGRNRFVTQALYVVSTLKNLLSFNPVTLQVDGKSHKLLSLIVSNINSYAGGCLLADSSLNSDGALQCVLIKHRWQYLQLLLGRFSVKLAPKGVKLSTLIVGANVIPRMQIDGEVVDGCVGEITKAAQVTIHV
jgi:diacylglycerol kinase family enzyme